MTKEPWLAVNFSMFIPGLGQCYGEKWFRGLFWFLITVGLVMASFWSIFSPQGDIITGVILGSAGLLIYLINIFDAHQVIYRQHKNPQLEKIPRTNKNPWFAVFASRIIPGLGHLYASCTNLGLILLVISLFTLQLKNFYPLLIAIYPILTAGSAYDVFRRFPKSKTLSSRYWIVLIALGILAWAIFLNYLPFWLGKRFEIFLIPSNSMLPTLQVGDRILVHKSADYLPKVGDIVVFQVFPELESFDPDAKASSEETFYVKRIIATPGTKIEIVQGKVLLNDYPLAENYLKETVNYQGGPLIVPANNYFVLGDNRNNSFDSHVWGFLPKQYIVGRAYKIYWPIQHQKSLTS